MSRSPERSEGDEAISNDWDNQVRDCSRLPKNLFGEQVASARNDIANLNRIIRGDLPCIQEVPNVRFKLDSNIKNSDK